MPKPNGTVNSPVFFSDHLPPLKKVFLNTAPSARQALLICDKKFRSHPLLKQWRNDKNLKFYYVPAGENTKSLENLPLHIKKIQSLSTDWAKGEPLFIGFGGGSLIDLTGFLAGIFKRGRPVAYFPTTWLSAIDSAHGGKTALNFQNIKNLLGLYHFPKAVFVVKAFLRQNPERLRQSALGELFKIAFINGGRLFEKLKKEKGKISLETFVKPAIRAKMKIVQADPFETKPLRKQLNLGHTVGHILESLCPLPHGTAVGQGLMFSLNWSYQWGLLNKTHFEEMTTLIPFKRTNKKIPLRLFKKHLRQDKKQRGKGRLDFVFIKRPGLALVKTVEEKALLKEAKRQGLIY